MTTTNISYFKGPLNNTVPCATCNIKELHKFITTDTRLQEATAKYRAIAPDDKNGRKAAKAQLPYVTPLGVFRRRLDTALIVPSGLIVIDVDKMESHEKACELRDILFEDKMLKPELTFVSVSGQGVKAFVPYCVSPTEPLKDTLRFVYETYWDYVEYQYGGKFLIDVDHCGDLSRSCSLCYDPDAKINV